MKCALRTAPLNKSAVVLYTVVVLAIAILLSVGGCWNRAQDTRPFKNLVFVSSFHDNHVWTENVRKSMLSTFARNGYRINATNIYLNSKKIVSADEWRHVLDVNLALTKDKIDAIIVSDLEATSQVLDYRDRIPDRVPIILVSEYDDPEVAKFDNVYLLTVEIGLRKTFETARRMFPAATNVYVWSDKTETGNYFLERARRQLKPYEDQIHIQYGIDAVDDADFMAQSREIKANSFVLFCTWQQGDNRTYYDPQIFYPRLTECTNAPVFSVVNNAMQDGFVGGYALSPFNNGARAAQKAMEIWRSSDRSQIPHLEVITSTPVFNKRVVSYWHAKGGAIPADAELLYDWRAYLEEYQSWICMGLGVLLVLGTIIFMLLYFRHTLLKKNEILRKSNADYQALMRNFQDQYHELEKSRNNLNMAIDVEDVNVWNYDPKTEIFHTLQSNSTVEAGVKMADFRNDIHPDDRQKVFAFLDSMKHLDHQIENGEIRKSGETRYRHLDGTFHYYKNHVLLKIENGEVVLVTGTQKDVTGDILYQRQLEEYRTKTELINNAFDIAQWDYDLELKASISTDHDAIIVNKYFTQQEHLQFVHEADRPILQHFYDQMDARVDRNVKAQFRLLLPGREGYRNVIIIGAPVKDEGGVVVSYTGMRRDETELIGLNNQLKKANRDVADSLSLINNIIEKLPMALFIKDVDNGLRYIIVNERLTMLHGVDKDTVIGHTDSELLDPDTAAMFHDEDLKAIAAAGASVTMIKPLRLNGAQTIQETAETLITSVDGRRYVIGIVMDVTERERINAELQRAKEQAETSDRLKSAFLANMSHEIRTPLNAIVGFSELLVGTESQAEKAEYSKIIQTNNEILLRLIGDILDLSKVEAGIIELKHEKFDLSPFFDELTTSLRQRLTNDQVQFVVENPYKSCVWTYDRNRFAQLLTNFVTNSIKYTPKGTIQVGYLCEEGGIKVYVKDTGIGLSESKKARVFGRFEKLDEFAQGTGLGLAICKALCEASGGRIGFESTEGVGSTFWAWIPCEQITISESIVEIPDARPESLALKDTPDSRIRILVAEDNDSNYMLMKSILKAYDLTRAENGQQAVDLVSQRAFDLVLMDIRMPVMDGLEATRQIRKFNTLTPIVAVTANAFDSDREEALKAGCNSFVAKPIKKQELLDLIEKR